jgi:hypothetical protein
VREADDLPSCRAERQEIRGLNLPGTPVGLLGLSVGVTFFWLKQSRYRPGLAQRIPGS